MLYPAELRDQSMQSIANRCAKGNGNIDGKLGRGRWFAGLPAGTRHCTVSGDV